MSNSVAALWPELDDALTDEEVVATGNAERVPLSSPPAVMSFDPRQQLIAPALAARHLGRSVATIHRWVRLQRLPVVKVGRSRLLRVSDVEAFVRDSLVEAITSAVGARK